MDFKKIDSYIKFIEESFNVYYLLMPINRQIEKNKFFSYYKKSKRYNPIYKYKVKNLKKIQADLKNLSKNMIKAKGMGRLFKEKIDNIIMKTQLVNNNDEKFSDLCSKLYGKPSKNLVNFAIKILKDKNNYKLPEENIKPHYMAESLKSQLRRYKINWPVIETSKIMTKISISSLEKKVFINTNYNYTESEIHRLEVHEMVHVFRTINGQNQPWYIFQSGFANYEETEEGLAVYTEDAKGKLKKDLKQLKIYAGRVLAVDIGLKNSFYKTFCELKRYFPDFLAYRLTERVKRGMKDTSMPGAFTKGYYYISGWQKVIKYLKNKGSLSNLYVGKIKIEDIDIVEDLLKKNVLSKPNFILK